MIAEQVIFAVVLFAVAMTQQIAAFYAFRRLRDEVLIDRKTYIWILWMLVAALISFLIVFVADVLTLVLPVPLTCK